VSTKASIKIAGGKARLGVLDIGQWKRKLARVKVRRCCNKDMCKYCSTTGKACGHPG
jgi:hypothetical protein